VCPDAAAAGLHPLVDAVGGKVEDQLPESKLPGREGVAGARLDPAPKGRISKPIAESHDGVPAPFGQDAPDDQIPILI